MELLTSGPAAHGPPVMVIAIDDDDDYREMLVYELGVQGFIVEAFSDAQSLLQSIGVADTADVIVVDWMMPSVSGIDFLPRLRQLGVDLPVIFLTERALTSNEALALTRGDGDFVDKSRGIGILVQQLHLVANVRAPGPRREELFQCGRLQLKPQVGRAFWDNINLNFTRGEFRVIQLLAENVGDSVAYRQIYDCMTPPAFRARSADDSYHPKVRATIKSIQGKFRALDPSFAKIRNRPVLGYVWESSSPNRKNNG